MKSSLQAVTAQSVEMYTQTDRKEWVLNWPGQVVLASSTIHWTLEVTQVRCHGYDAFGNFVVEKANLF